MKYSDIISLQDYFHPVFNLQNEAVGYWKQFIPTTQFIDLLIKTLDAVSSNVPAKRKSIWVQGTFGTGKSHAGSVIKHLLCDDITEIEDYISEKIYDVAIKSRLTALRGKKQFFPVVLSGVEGVYNSRTFELSLERTIKNTLREKGHNIQVKNDFERAIDLLENNKALDFSEIIENEPNLQIISRTKEGIINKLHTGDIETYLALENALAKYSVQLSSGNITKWLSEIETAIVTKKIADGLIILWDEFTSVMDTISEGLINTIQKIAELTEKQNIYLYLISHRVPVLIGEKGQDITKMNDRFHIIQYKMEAIATYRIMSATIKVNDKEQYDFISESSLNRYEELISYLTGNDKQQSKLDIQRLFPMHPYTAFLCSSLADHIGSANRSVFSFMYNDENGFLGFLSDENAFKHRRLLTADSLWDFFFETFSNDPSKYSIVIERYESYINNVSLQGEAYKKVFKGILLLNAMKNTFEKDQVLPSKTNIKRLFCGEPFEENLNEILHYLDRNQIVQKDPSDNFLIAFSSLPLNEINKEKENAKLIYTDAVNVIKFDPSQEVVIEKLFSDSLVRTSELLFLPCALDEPLLKSRLYRGFKEPHSLHIALFFAMNAAEREAINDIVKRFADEEFKNIIFVIFNEVLDYNSRDYQLFIDYIANHQVAKRHNSPNDQIQSHHKNAKLIVANWIKRIRQGTFNILFRNENESQAVSNIADYINKNIGHKIFNKGFESLQTIRSGSMSFFRPQKSKKIAEVMLSSIDRDDTEVKLSGQYATTRLFLKNNNDDYIVENNMELKSNAPENHPLVSVQKLVDKLLDDVRKQNSSTFNLGKVLEPLIESPFGLYSNIPNVAILAYSLRKYLNELYHTEVGVPITADNLRDKVVDLFSYWQNGRNENKLRVRFGSREEKELKDLLIQIFDLSVVPEVPELTSIKNVRWGIAYFSKNIAKHPLWCLKYSNNANNVICNLIDQLVELVHEEETQPEQIKKTLKSIKDSQFELQKLLLNKTAFEEGFKNYIDKIESVTIKDYWWEELDEFLLKRMQREVGWWKESDVASKVKDFYIKKIAKSTSNDTTSAIDNRSTAQTTDIDEPYREKLYISNSTLIEKADSVKKKITQIDLPTPALKWILVRVLEKFPETADIIDSNL